MRVLVVSHDHPDLSIGGAQRAAYSLFSAIRARGLDGVFLARTTQRVVGHDGPFGAFRGREDELLFVAPPVDQLDFRSTARQRLRRLWAEIVECVEPDVIHFHHFANLGVDLFEISKALHPCPIVLTLHEYLLICHNHGQMVKTGTHQPCHRSSPAECAACFPALTSGAFHLRNLRLREALDAVDRLIAPSDFLRCRMIEWGIAPERIATIENLQPFAARADDPGDDGAAEDAVVVGYFGQVSAFKGILVLLSAIELLNQRHPGRFVLKIFGGRIERQPEALQDEIRARLARLEGVVHLHGPYRGEDGVQHIRGVDCVVVPSIWWENSPLVIQEAIAAGRPVICSDIGGMAEKVLPGRDGVHFRVGDPEDLARRLAGLNLARWRRTLRAKSPGELMQENELRLEAHLDVYQTARRTSARAPGRLSDPAPRRMERGEP